MFDKDEQLKFIKYMLCDEGKFDFEFDSNDNKYSFKSSSGKKLTYSQALTEVAGWFQQELSNIESDNINGFNYVFPKLKTAYKLFRDNHQLIEFFNSIVRGMMIQIQTDELDVNNRDYMLTAFEDLISGGPSVDIDGEDEQMEELKENDLELRSKKHKSSIAKGGIGWFQNIGSKEGINRFNNSTSGNVPSPDGGSAVSADASGGVGEALEEDTVGRGWNRGQLMDAIKKLGVNYKLDKYSDQQLYNILNRLNQKKQKELNSAKINDVESNKVLTDNDNYDYLGSVDNRKIFRRKDTGDYGVEGFRIRFATEQDAIEFAEER